MPTTHASISKKQLWAGRILSGLPAAFMLFDGGMKLFKPAPVVKATLQLGYGESVIVGLGLVLLASLFSTLSSPCSLVLFCGAACGSGISACGNCCRCAINRSYQEPNHSQGKNCLPYFVAFAWK